MELRFYLGANFIRNADFASSQERNLLTLVVARKLREEINWEVKQELLIVNNLVKIILTTQEIINDFQHNCEIIIFGYFDYDSELKTDVFKSSKIIYFGSSYSIHNGIGALNGENYLKYIFPNSYLID